MELRHYVSAIYLIVLFQKNIAPRATDKDVVRGVFYISIFYD